MLSPAEAAELPDWLWDRLGAALPADERDALARAWLAPAPLDLRVNPLKITRDAGASALAASGIDAEPTPYSPLGLRVAGKPALQRIRCSLSGAIEVQDEGSQLLGLLVAPKRTDMVVDFCAGAGGKTLLLGALMRSQGRLYAFDVSRARLAQLQAAARALGTVERAADADRERARHAKSSGSPARSTACWSTRRAAASARCAAIRTSSGGRRRKRSPSSRPSRRGSSPRRRRW